MPPDQTVREIRPDPRLSNDLAICAGLIRQGSKSFYRAAHLLPNDVRQAAFALYAFCREADDAVDEGRKPERAVAELRERLAAAYAGSPANRAADRAFAWVVSAHAIPRALPEALIEGFSWDAMRRTYRTLDDVKAYACRVASTVGIMMSMILGARDAEALARAADLGLAMQLTNIARDIGEDARAGRCYLPLDWLEEKRLSLDSLAAMSSATPEVCALTARLLRAAEPLYASGLAGVPYLRSDCRAAIRAAAGIYAAIGDAIARNRHDSVARRAFVSGQAKLLIGLRALAAPPRRQAARPVPADPAPRFLVDAAARLAPARVLRPEPVPREGTVPWMIELFMALESRPPPETSLENRALPAHS